MNQSRLSLSLRSLLGGLALLAWSAVFAQRPFAIHAPSTINQKELYRLILLCNHQKFDKDQVVESPQGDVLIDLKQNGVFLISHESELMAPINLSRELFALFQKHGEDKLIPFSELSKSALNVVRTDLWRENPRYDFGDSSCFALTLQFGKDIHTGHFSYSTYGSPGRFGSEPTSKDKNAEFIKTVRTKPINVMRSELEAKNIRESRLSSSEGVFYDQTIQLRPKIDVHRRGLEIFESWSQQELQRLDALMGEVVNSGAKWGFMRDYVNKQKVVRSMDEFRQATPDEFFSLVSEIQLNYKTLGLTSPDEAEGLLNKATIKMGFHFSVLAALEGQVKMFSFGPKG